MKQSFHLFLILVSALFLGSPVLASIPGGGSGEDPTHHDDWSLHSAGARDIARDVTWCLRRRIEEFGIPKAIYVLPENRHGNDDGSLTRVMHPTTHDKMFELKTTFHE